MVLNNWRSVKEELPDLPPCTTVLVAVNKPPEFESSNGLAIAMWVPEYTNNVEEFPYDHDCPTVFDEDGEEYWPEGWYESNIGYELQLNIEEEVTHWMSLPPTPENERSSDYSFK